MNGKICSDIDFDNAKLVIVNNNNTTHTATDMHLPIIKTETKNGDTRTYQIISPENYKID